MNGAVAARQVARSSCEKVRSNPRVSLGLFDTESQCLERFSRVLLGTCRPVAVDLREYNVEPNETAWRVYADGTYLLTAASRDRALMTAEALARASAPSNVIVKGVDGQSEVTLEYR